MKLDATARLNLMKFVCSFVWTDLKVHQQERDLVMRIAGRLGLTEAESQQVQRWLQVPPPIDEVDPSVVPPEHRALFMNAAEMAIKADGRIVPAERDSLALFKDLLK